MNAGLNGFSPLCLRFCCPHFFSSWILLPEDFIEEAYSALSAALFSANIHYWLNISYFDSPTEDMPFLHTWSLAVEEQFYIVFPILLLALRKVKQHILALIFLMLLVVSLATSQWLVSYEHTSAFYLLHSRAWELLIGALLALGIIPDYESRILRNVLGLIGVALISWAVFAFTKETEFPGLSALIPCIGTAFILYAGRSGTSFVSRVLSLKPIVFIGLISYSLYLWHWPIIVLTKYYVVFPLSDLQIAGLLALTFFVSAFSWHFIEKPFRYSKLSSARILGSGAGMVTVTALASYLVIVTDGFLPRLSPERIKYVSMMNKETFFKIYDRGGCFLDYHQGTEQYDLKKCASSSPEKTRILIWGDSFAANLYPGLKQRLESERVSVHQYTATACRPIYMEANRCKEVYDSIDRVVSHLDPDFVIVAGFWPRMIHKLGKEEFASRLATSVSKLRNSGTHVILTGQSPTYEYSLAKLGFLHEKKRSNSKVNMIARDNEQTQALISRVARQEKVDFIDFYQLCKNRKCLAFSKGEPLHWDYGHMTMAGSMHYSQILEDVINLQRDDPKKTSRIKYTQPSPNE